MKPEEINIFDWARIFAGDVPATFYLELLIRAAFIYLLLMVSMRLLGKRMSTQMSRLELAAMVSLAAAVGVPLLAPDRGLLPAVVIAIVVVVTVRLVAWLSMRNQKFERISQDHLDTLVADGVLQTSKMAEVRISRELVMAQLRKEQLLHTGSVKRLYMEANGAFSLVRSTSGKAGLPVLPDWDEHYIAEKLEPAGILLCKHCGAPAPPDREAEICSQCGCNDWTMAMQEKQA